MLAEREQRSASLQQAIRNANVSTKQGFLQNLFAFWFDAFVYNQIWEDPRVDLEALQLDENSRVLTISSGGCNALNYLLAGPRSVTAVDLNRHHVYLLNLKLAALLYLPDHESFFAFFRNGGLYDHSRNGFFLKFFHRYARFLGCEPSKIVEAKTPEEQAAVFDYQIDPF